ncbi:thiamine kinase-like enzyme [Lederbergia galactosidilyticus]|uniref:phosphotransferase n=1 Tax=Lederbergia galactosidilytica TaxID=217031 RepID=UPI001AE9B180|nr:phosphotransferase [Lederbergia galactosidilytica]MBP1914907.1 thiamine kinase-like enzyme [Lederbergia galactosidilytica]
MNKDFFEERDGMKRRLLLLLKENFDLPFIRINPIKNMVWKVSTQNQDWILKGFSSLETFKRQVSFTEQLKKSGFTQIYSFHPKPFVQENKVFGLIQFIEAKKGRKVSYSHESDIRDVCFLLRKYHHATTNLSNVVKEQIPVFEQINKWKKRLIDYRYTLPLYSQHPLRSHLNYFAELGEWALDKLQNQAAFFKEEPNCIIHGDVASHNFIRDKNGQLWLIDFDLIALAPPHIDYLQLSNRVLPHLGWDVERLFSFQTLQPFKTKEAFLTALVYPTDIFREWLHFTRSHTLEQRRRWSTMEALLLKQFKERIKFSKEIMKKVKSI